MTNDQTSNDPMSTENSPNDAPIMVHTTCADQEEAERLAAETVKNRLAACASVGPPVVSIYPWEGKIERDTETPLTLKTTRARFAALREYLDERHSYDVPELLAVEVVDGNDDYIEWIRNWVAGREDV